MPKSPEDFQSPPIEVEKPKEEKKEKSLANELFDAGAKTIKDALDGLDVMPKELAMKDAHGAEKNKDYFWAATYYDRAGETEKAIEFWEKAAQECEKEGSYEFASLYYKKAANFEKADGAIKKYEEKKESAINQVKEIMDGIGQQKSSEEIEADFKERSGFQLKNEAEDFEKNGFYNKAAQAYKASAILFDASGYPEEISKSWRKYAEIQLKLGNKEEVLSGLEKAGDGKVLLTIKKWLLWATEESKKEK